MTVRVGINGFGRIGRALLRCVCEDVRPGSDVEVVAVNDRMPTDIAAHLLRYDSTYGPLRLPVGVAGENLVVAGRRVLVLREPRPADLPWGRLDVDVVVEASGRFRGRAAAAGHLDAGASKVVITAPGRDVDATFVMGVNDVDYAPNRHHVVSNASCTTNCVAPMVLVLHRAFGIRRGLLTAVHSYTSDQPLLDGLHQDLRRARSAAVNMIPTTTGAARALDEVIPELAGRLDGVAVRVPVDDGSLTDLTVELEERVTVGQVNRAFADAAAGSLKEILRYSEAPLVSRDVLGDPSSCVFDAGLTRAKDRMVKVFGWYDNEWGYACRTLDLVELVGHSLALGR